MSRGPAAILVDAAGNVVGIVDISGTKYLQTEVKRLVDAVPIGDNRIGRVKLTDDTSVLVIPVDGGTLAAGVGVPVMGRDSTDLARFLMTDGEGRLAVSPKPPTAPPGTTPFTLAVNEAELEVGTGGDVASPHDTLGAIIGNGLSLKIQVVTAGSEGDSSENGSVVEVYWRTSGPTDHLVERIYILGETVTVTLPEIDRARDGTLFTGDGVDTRIVVRRRRLSNAAQEVDFVIRGYTE
jgi:hypothetical protein